MAPIDKSTVGKYDWILIGGGSGGVAAGRRAASYGQKVAVIESARLGGTCVNVGCVPKKIMWHAADLADKLRHAGAGYQFANISPPSFNWAAFKTQRDAYILKLNGIYSNNLSREGVEYHRGIGKLLSPTSVQITRLDENGQPNAEAYTLHSDRICIATGGRPTIPSDDSIPGASKGIDSDGFFSLEEQPKRVGVVGAGYIAVELSGVLNALGSETHMFIRGNTVLRTFDHDIQETLTPWMEHSGVKIHKTSNVTKVDGEKGSTLTVHTDKGEKVDVDVLIWAIGRHANTEELGIEEVGVKLDKKGDVVVDEFQNSNVEGITSIGDVQGKSLLTPVAIAAGRRLANRLFGPEKFKNDKLSFENIPTVVFAHPTIGTVGLTEAQARQKYGDEVKTYKSKFSALYFAMVDEEHREPTMYKLIVVGPEERVVGVHILGLGSDEIMQGFGVAIKMKARKQDLDDTVAIHPTSAEELVTLR